MDTPNTADDLLALLDAKVAAAPKATNIPALPLVDMSAIAELSAALTTDVTVTVPDMMRPFLPFQAVAYLYAQGALDRWPGLVIGDDMGLGKTQVMQALLATVLSKRGGRAVVVAPPITFGGWATDLRAAFPSLTIAQLKGRKAPKVCTTCGHEYDTPTTDVPCIGHAHTPQVTLPEADVLFISDDPLTLRAWLTHGLNARKQFVLSNVVTDTSVFVRDEIHRDKGADGRPGSPTSRAKLMLAIGDALRGKAPIIAASGSLTVNRPIESLIPFTVVGGLPLLKALAPGIKNAIGFAFRYCNPVNAGFGYSYAGANEDRLPELNGRMRENMYVRRDKDAVPGLPHFAWHVVPYALNGKLARLRKLENEFLDIILAEEGIESMWRKSRAKALTQMQAMWEEAGVAKAQAAVDYLLADADQGVNLTAGKPVILFYWHQSTHEALRKALADVVIPDPALGTDDKGKVLTRKLTTASLNGSIIGDKRQAVVDAFQAGQTDVLLAQLKSAGVGVTLTAAADAVFVQCPFSAGDLAQAAGRIRRVDQVSRDRGAAGEGVRYHVLLATHENGDQTIDHAQFAMVEAKARITDVVNSGGEITMPEESVMFGAMRQWYEGRQR